MKQLFSSLSAGIGLSVSVLACTNSACGSNPSAQPLDAATSKPTDAGTKVDVSSDVSTTPVDADAGDAVAEHIAQYDDFACTPASARAECTGGYCKLPAGCFVMGSPADTTNRAALGEDLHKVTFTHAAWLGESEFTRGAYLALGFAPPIAETDQTITTACTESNCPIGVTFYDALAIANAQSAKEGRPSCYNLSACTGTVGATFTCSNVTLTTPTQSECTGYRLPTRAEFEYAMRAGTNNPLPGGKFTGDLAALYDEPNLRPWAWYAIDGNIIHPVKQKRANGYGLFDIFGNVMEWVMDPCTPIAFPPEQVDPERAIDFSIRPIEYIPACARGGVASYYPAAMAATKRALDIPPNTKSPGTGLRLIRSDR